MPNSKFDEREIIEANYKGISMRLALIMPTFVHILVKSTKEAVILDRGLAFYLSKERSLGTVSILCLLFQGLWVIANIFSPIYVIVHNNLNFKLEELYQNLPKIHCNKAEKVFRLPEEESNAMLLLGKLLLTHRE